MILATRLLLLIHSPFTSDVNVVVSLIHISEGPLFASWGSATTAIGVPNVCTHPNEEVNVKLADPPETPVTTPMFETVAIDSSLLSHVPPVVGSK